MPSLDNDGFFEIIRLEEMGGWTQPNYYRQRRLMVLNDLQSRRDWARFRCERLLKDKMAGWVYRSFFWKKDQQRLVEELRRIRKHYYKPENSLVRAMKGIQ